MRRSQHDPVSEPECGRGVSVDQAERARQISRAVAEVLNCTAVLASPEHTASARANVNWPEFLTSFRENLRIALETLDQPNPTLPLPMLEAVLRLQGFESLLLAEPIDWPLVHEYAKAIVAPFMAPPAS